MRRYEIDSFTYETRSSLLPRLVPAIAEAGGCVVERRMPSADRTELVVELRPRAGLDLCFALAAHGIELSRAAQQTLIAVCDRRSHMGYFAGAFGATFSIRLIVRFLEDAPFATLLTRSSLIV